MSPSRHDKVGFQGYGMVGNPKSDSARKGTKMANTDPELYQVIAQLRTQLALARAEGAKKNLRFSLDEIEVELAFSVTRDLTADGGVKFWVLNASVKSDQSNVITQKIKLKMKIDGDDNLIGDKE